VWRWSIIGVVLAVAFIAHDVAMAANPHVRATLDPGHSHDHGNHASHTAMVAGHPAPVPAHGSLPGCGTRRVVTLNSISGPELPVVIIGTADSLGNADAERAHSPATLDELVRPQDVQRALLQVFLE
jgi:hypothetical protein